MAFQGNHYIATFDLPGGGTQKIEVFGKDDSDAKTKVELIYPTASNIVVSSATTN
tara:strand:- start:387 stop:551 length:165 start_codon:yes stop_codon:yes gene_type:complete